jgi:tetratricopeptide (TPR) repeat protein
MNLRDSYAEAEALEARGDLAGAEAQYRQLLAAMPGQPLLLARLALLRKLAGAHNEAEGLLRRAIVAAPQEAALHNNLGNVLRNLARGRDAEGCYRRALALNPNYGEAAYNLGVVLEDAGRDGEALEAYRLALKLKHEVSPVRTRMAAVQLRLGQANDALTEADAAVVGTPASFEGHYYRGIALARLERLEEAVATLQEAVRLRPTSLEALSALANNLKAADRHDEAMEVYWRTLDAHPLDVGTHNDLNRHAWTTGRTDAFLTSFARVRQRSGENPDLMVAEAQLRTQCNDDASAEGLLRKALVATPERADANAMLGRILAKRGDFEESFRRFEAALKGDPSAAVYRNEFGYALLQGREHRLALVQFEAARRANPVDQLALAGLCLAYRALGDSRYRELFNVEKFVRAYPLAVPAGFADARAFNAALAEELSALHTTKAEPLDQTLRQGTQTPGLLFSRKGRMIEQVREQIGLAVSDYIAAMDPDTAHPLLSRKKSDWSFTHSWSCKLRSSGYHTNHVHPMGWISSAYYVDLPGELDDAAQRQGWLKFGESHLEIGDGPEHYVKPRVGHLVLFPSYFWHGTVPFESKDERLTIAFDVVPGTVDPRSIATGPY